VVSSNFKADGRIDLRATSLILDERWQPKLKRTMPPSSPYTPYTPSHRPTPTPSQWFFTKSELQSTPSILAGMTPEQEKAGRAKGIQLINEVGQKLRLHQTTIGTAAIFFHRFYMRMSLQTHHHYVRLPSLPSPFRPTLLDCSLLWVVL